MFLYLWCGCFDIHIAGLLRTSLINRSVSIIINGQRALKTKVFVLVARWLVRPLDAAARAALSCGRLDTL